MEKSELEQVYWNGLETTGVRGTAIVAPAPEFPNYWAKDLVDERIHVVQINLDGVNSGGGIDYLDNRDGSGWQKVTEGRGSPQYGHRNVIIVPGSFEISEDDRERYFKELQELKEMKETYEKIIDIPADLSQPIGFFRNRADRRAASKKSRKRRHYD